MSWIVAEVMTHDVVTVQPSTPFNACLRLMRLHGVGALPVIDDGRLVGIVTMTDLVLKERRPSVRERYEGRGLSQVAGGLTAEKLMSPHPIRALPETPLRIAVREMFQHRINRLPVVDHEDRLLGIISRSDVLRMFLRSDLAIRKDVDRALTTDLQLVAKGTIRADVHDGVVTLQGELEPGALTGVLLRLVASVPGVVGVKNRMKVRRALAQAAHV
jgi:CBS domain-containing protein